MALFFWGYLLVSLFWLQIYHAFVRRGDLKGAHQYACFRSQHWAGLILKYSGVEVEVSGVENVPAEGPVLFVPNHQSYFDIPVIVSSVPRGKGFIVKKEVEKLPILNHWIRGLGCVFLDRTNAREGLKAISQGVELMKEGKCIVLFPEGTRSTTGELAEFKSGGFRLAIKSGATIIPVAMDGVRQIFEANGKKIRPGKVRVLVGKPLTAESIGSKDTEVVSQATREQLLALLQQLRRGDE
jgi:1-acyl-sn-glycerol-3-phosphate acyltransferase